LRYGICYSSLCQDKPIEKGIAMRILRIVTASLALALTLSGCIIVARPFHPWYWGPPRCYRC